MTTPWARAGVAMGVLLGAWGLAFAGEIVAAVSTWNNSTAYNHCWLVLPVAAWLGWVRRGRLAGLVPRPAPLAAVLALGGGVAWLVAERMGIMEGRQLAALGILLTLVVAVFGWAICRAMAAPLLYLVFLVPFGGFLVPVLQDVTAWMIVAGLRILEIPHFADALIIEIPAGIFLVAEACAGLRFIIASLAFGALYALTMFRSPGRRLTVMLLAVVVPVVANGLRALGIVLLGHHLGSAEAGAADHLVYGWVFFSVVILLLTVAGLPFRQDSESFAPLPARSHPMPRPLLPSALLAGALGLAVPLAIGLLRETVPAAERLALQLEAPAGCAVQSDTIQCGSHILSAEAFTFPSGTTWSAVVAQRLRLSGHADDALVYTGAHRWQGRQSPGSGTVLAATWLDGNRVGDGLRSRAYQGWNSLFGGQGRPVVAVIALRPTSASRPDDAAEARQSRAILDMVAQRAAPAIEVRSQALSRN